ncbi:hypothetical protein H2202_004194 [Exophiala xenobiotica]|nr:hypothetical protein H2202_004194 [Exophiala xenobiotica]KAK5206066.1 hypothetical protein LTR41_008348 [Exophiala xenobiotica]KAK5233886.1 hypothetical protein LTR47_005004 [Exophiala xenobiotica]KAK5242210.1 hypothetical protein LTS06_011666 [Exophiala xenobiotica]KAK5281017.1 hypothetical protein LTR40_005543 [Exophiala xenobiotica]
MTHLVRNGLATIFGRQQHASWPDPAESTGELLKVVHNVKYWEAKGPARDAFKILSPDIANHLEQYLDSLPRSSWVTFSVYMVGDVPETTQPVVMFICDQTGPCREAQKLIDESGLLEDFPGMKSGIADVPPDFDCLDQLASHSTPLLEASSRDQSSQTSICVTGKVVSVTTLTEYGLFSQTATIGGFVQHNQETYIYTAGHLFQAATPQECASQPASLPGGPSAHVNGTVRAELAAFSTDLDYALIKVHDPASIPSASDNQDFRSTRPTHVVRAPLKTVSITAETASAGTVKGTLYATPSLTRLPNSKSFQRVYRARFSSPLVKGDCGTWVVDEATRGLYGHIIAGGEHNAYIMPAHDVFRDAEAQLGDRIGLLQHPCADSTSAELPTGDDSQEDPSYAGHLGIANSFTSPKSGDRMEQESVARRKIVPLLRKSKSARLETMSSATHTFFEYESDRRESTDAYRLLSHPWDMLFATRRNIDGCRKEENIPYIEVLLDVLDHDKHDWGDEGSSDEYDYSLTCIDFIMNDCGMWPSGAYRVGAYLSKPELNSLQADVWPGKKLPCKAWVGDGGEGWFKPCAEWLTAHQLYQALRKPRFWRHESPSSSNECAIDEAMLVDISPVNNSPPAEHKMYDAPDIERRQIFIYDLDVWNILALTTTASENQSEALRDTISKYLTSQSSIAVTVSDGWPTFQLSLHVPYFAWRSSLEPREDSRLDRSGQPLRHVRDVSLLNSDGETSFLYEAQISCVVAGIDDWRWVAYCFVDSYFDGENTTQDDGDMFSGYDGFGQYGVIGGPDKARLFFLNFLRIRVRLITDEWEEVVRNVEKSFRKFAWVRVLSFFLVEEADDHMLTKAQSHQTRRARPPALSTSREEHWEKNADTTRESLEWVGSTISIFTELSEALSKTCNTWSKFEQHHLADFQGLAETSWFIRTISEVRRMFEMLESTKATVDAMAKRAGFMQRELLLQLSHHNMEVGEQQRKLAGASKELGQYNKRLSFTMICLTPVTLTASLLSMNHEVFLFIPRTATSFIFLFLGIGILSVMMYQVQTYPFKHWGSLVAKARFRWHAGPWPPSLEAPLRYLRGNDISRPNEDTQDDEKDALWALWKGQEV